MFLFGLVAINSVFCLVGYCPQHVFCLVGSIVIVYVVFWIYIWWWAGNNQLCVLFGLFIARSMLFVIVFVIVVF